MEWILRLLQLGSVLILSLFIVTGAGWDASWRKAEHRSDLESVRTVLQYSAPYCEEN